MSISMLRFGVCLKTSLQRKSVFEHRRCISFSQEKMQIKRPPNLCLVKSIFFSRDIVQFVKYNPLSTVKRFITTRKEQLENNVDFKKLNVDKETAHIFQKISKGDGVVLTELGKLYEKVKMMEELLHVEAGMKEQEWKEFLNSSQCSRKGYLSYIFQRAIKREKTHKRKYLYDLPFHAQGEMSENYDDPNCYHLFHNSMFLKFRTQSLRKLLLARMMSARIYSPELFFDFSYNDYMSAKETKLLCKQLGHIIKINGKSEEPFNLVFCNFSEDSVLNEKLKCHSTKIFDHYYPITITPKCFTDFYPKNKLVYLSPHCNKSLKKLEPDKRYIIGAFVDKVDPKPLSLAKAKEKGIEMAKFPLNEYVNWQQGHKSLCLNHCLEIMLNLKNHNNNWHKALEVIPKRFTTVRQKRKVSNIASFAEMVFQPNAKYLIKNNTNYLDINLEDEYEDEDEGEVKAE